MADQAESFPESFTDSPAPIDYDILMHANLVRVFNERDAARRMEAIRALYTDDATLNEPHASIRGHAAISDAVTALLASLPSDFVFTPTEPAIGHHDVGCLKWRAGPPAGPIAVTGMDVAHFANGRIHVLHVFLDSSPDTHRT